MKLTMVKNYKALFPGLSFARTIAISPMCSSRATLFQPYQPIKPVISVYFFFYKELSLNTHQKGFSIKSNL